MTERRSVRWYASLVRPLLFRLDAEFAHHATLRACQIAGAIPFVGGAVEKILACEAEELAIDVAGLHFRNPIGLAAGWDKDALALRLMDHLGFGFSEIGSISAVASIGNPKPRLFRVPDEQAIVVNYGLPNAGAAVIAKRLAKHEPRIPRGVNLVTTNRGANAAACSAEEIFEDYATSVSRLQHHASYLTLNLSCPNAKGGKDFFAEPGRIAQLLTRLSDCHVSCPVFLKLPPSVSPAVHDQWLNEVDSFPFVRGFQFNLAPGKPDWLNWNASKRSLASMPGAVAGAPVAKRMNQAIAMLYARMNRERYAIIGGGGVFTADDAWEKIRLGASLIQIYTAMIYRGPGVVRQINEGLLQRMRSHGFQSLSQAVGTGNKQAVDQ